MNWFNLTIVALGLIIGYATRREQTAESSRPGESYHPNEALKKQPEKSRPSDILDDLIDASKSPLKPIQRNDLLTKIITRTYRHRADVCMKKIFKRFARIHIDEFPDLAPVLKSKHGNSLPEIPTFKLFARVLEEEENYAGAMVVCKMALEYGIEDGTKSGFRGRIKRLQKKQRARRP